MKKIFLLIVLIALSSCKSTSGVTLLTPVGAPSITFYNSFSFLDNFETNSTPSNIISFLYNGSPYSYIVAPLDQGINALNKEIINYQDSDFKLSAVITFGNFFVINNHLDNDDILNVGDNVLLFQKGSVSDLIFQKVYPELFKKDNLSHIFYVSSVSETVSAIRNGNIITSDGTIKIDYTLSAAPIILSAIEKSSLFIKPSIYCSLKEKYEGLKKDNLLLQAGLFINTKKIKKEKSDLFLENLNKDILLGINDPSQIINGLLSFNSNEEDLKRIFGIPSLDILKKSLDDNLLGLGFLKAILIKKSIISFLDDINSISGGEDEKIYY